MGLSRIFTRNRLITILLVITSLLILKILWDIASTTNLGGGDFWGYWSATFLLRNGQNPYDPEAMRLVQATQMHTGLDFTIMSWNPPSLFVVILPLTLLSIIPAKFIWLIANLALVTSTILILIKLYLPHDNAKLNLAFMFFAFIMPQIMSGVYVGQVTILVTFGLVASMLLIKKNQWFWAGVVLILTSIKPHLVVLQIIYLLFYMAQNRKIKGWAGIFAAGIACLVVLFAFRPQLISDLVGLSKIAPTKWYTPTIGGWISYLGITEITRYLIALFLPIPFILAKYRTSLSMEFSIALLTLITVPFTFFGWSYDQVILLVPIAQIFAWLYQSKAAILKYTLAILMLAVVGINYYQKITGIYEVYYVWVPVFWCLIFAIIWHHSTRSTYSYE
jgi:hypothetical protein